MLTSDLVLVRRRKGELTLPELNGKSGDEVRHWAEQVLDAAGGCVGLPRQHYASLVKVMGETQQHRKLARGLAKLVEDACDFDEANLEDSAAIRRELFVRATEVRRSSPAEWNRNSIVQQLCAERGWTPDGLEGRLYADLPGAQRLLRVPDWTPEILVNCYDNSRVQAVLLRAVQVRVTYRETTSAQLRELFHQLKFRRLLHHSQRIEPRGLGLTIDGPYSLFESVTKYGLQLALLVTALRDAGDFELDADVLWGADRERLNFRYAYRALGNRGHVERVAEERTEQADELQQLMSDISAISSRFSSSAGGNLDRFAGNRHLCARSNIRRY